MTSAGSSPFSKVEISGPFGFTASSKDYWQDTAKDSPWAQSSMPGIATTLPYPGGPYIVKVTRPAVIGLADKFTLKPGVWKGESLFLPGTFLNGDVESGQAIYWTSTRASILGPLKFNVANGTAMVGFPYMSKNAPYVTGGTAQWGLHTGSTNFNIPAGQAAEALVVVRNDESFPTTVSLNAP